jgi:hypothetical protein
MTPGSSVYRFLSHPLTGGVTVTFVATLVFTVLSRLLRVHHSLGEEAKGWLGRHWRLQPSARASRLRFPDSSTKCP